MRHRLLTVYNGATAFTPASVAGLVAWYDFSDAATLFTDSARTTAVTADGDAIGSISDKSGNNYHQLQATAGNRPIYKTGIQNGKSIGREVSNDYLSASTGSVSVNALTIFCVAKTALAGNASPYFWNNSVSGAMASIYHVAGGQWRTQLYDGSHLDQISGTSTQNNFTLVRQMWSGTQTKLFVNGAQESTTGSWSFTVTSFNTIYLFNQASSTYLRGDIGEVLFYNAALSEANIALIESYLNTKWAVY